MSVLIGQLEAVRRRHRRLMRGRRVWAALGWWLGALWLAAMVDAAWSLIGARWVDDPFTIVELPPEVRAMMGVAMIVGFGAMMWHCRLPQSVRRRTPADYARWCQTRRGLTNNVLTNAVALRGRADDPSPIVRELANRAVERGDALAGDLSPESLIDRRPVRRQLRWLIAVMVLWAMTIAAGPMITPYRVGPTNVVRLFDPAGDHPPVAWVGIVVEVAPSTVAVGDDVTVAGIVRHGSSPLRLRMDDGRTIAMSEPWRATLRQIERPMRFVVEGGHTRTRWQVIDPLALPRVLAVSVTVSPPQSDVRYPWPNGQPVAAPTGSVVRVAVQSDRADARIDHPSARGMTVALPVAKDKRSYGLSLITPDGLRSRSTITLEVQGLSDAELTQLAAGDVEPTGSAALDSGTPTEATSAGGSPKPDEATSTSRTTGRGGTEGEGVTGEGNKPIPLPELVRGLTSEQAIARRLALPDVRSFAEVAPPSYRERVARYFVRITAEGRKEREPSHD